MPANKNTKKPTRSRTAQTGLKKKIHVPIWAVVAGVLVVAGIGIAFVYNSFAGSGYTRLTVYCRGYNSTLCSSRRSNAYNIGKRAEKRRISNTCQAVGGYQFRFVDANGKSTSKWHCLLDGA